MAKIDPYNKGYVSYLDFLDKFEQRETEVCWNLLYLSFSERTLAWRDAIIMELTSINNYWNGPELRYF